MSRVPQDVVNECEGLSKGEDIQQIRTSHKRRKNRAGIKEKR